MLRHSTKRLNIVAEIILFTFFESDTNSASKLHGNNMILAVKLDLQLIYRPQCR